MIVFDRLYCFCSAPSILEVKCDPPSDPTNVYHTLPGKLQYSQNVTFHCDPGYTVTGSESGTCQVQE